MHRSYPSTKLTVHRGYSFPVLQCFPHNSPFSSLPTWVLKSSVSKVYVVLSWSKIFPFLSQNVSVLSSHPRLVGTCIVPEWFLVFFYVIWLLTKPLCVTHCWILQYYQQFLFSQKSNPLNYHLACLCGRTSDCCVEIFFLLFSMVLRESKNIPLMLSGFVKKIKSLIYHTSEAVGVGLVWYPTLWSA